MAYKNINLSELGTRQKITYVASKVALFVPKMLSRLSKKLIIKPVTKIVTGSTYEEVKAVAENDAMQIQKQQAEAMQEKIDEGKQNLEEWHDDEEYYVGNLAKYKSYSSTIDDLVKKQNKLLQSPKRLLVAKTYLSAMKKIADERRSKRKEAKRINKTVQQIIYEYSQKKSEIESQKERVAILAAALKEEQELLDSLTQDVENYKNTNADVIGQYEQQFNQSNEVIQQEPVQQVPNFIEGPTVFGDFESNNEPSFQTVEGNQYGVPFMQTQSEVVPQPAMAEEQSLADRVKNANDEALLEYMGENPQEEFVIKL